MAKQAKVLNSRVIYRGRAVELRVDRVVEPGGVETTRELICHPGSVVVIPHLPGDRLILVRQYRYAAQASMWELVAGGLEPGEIPSQAARRELREEAGYRARHVKRLVDFFPSPGILNEKMHLVEAWDLTPSQGQPDDDERIEAGIFAIEDVLQMIRKKEINDGKTLLGILWVFGDRFIAS